MRINRETLLKIAKETVAQRTRRGHDVLAVYLSGSLLGDDFLLGGTTDIDLTFLHLNTPNASREVVRLADEVHLDIAHYDQRDFSQPRRLRQHPWLGPVLFECKILYDPQHFLDFIQASVRGQFYRSDHVLDRARQQLEHARQIWAGFASQVPPHPEPADLSTYLRAIDHAANAVAVLNGPPLTERRLLLNFPQRAEAAGHPGLYPALLGMLGAPHVDGGMLRAWSPAWEAALAALPEESAPPKLHPCRIPYYHRAFESILNGEHPQAVLWLLLRTWTQAAGLLSKAEVGRTTWSETCAQLELLGDGFDERVQALDAFLDLVDETLDDWLRSQGG